ncbi:MAG: ATP-binding protein [Acidobacteriota bacterium]
MARLPRLPRTAVSVSKGGKPRPARRPPQVGRAARPQRDAAPEPSRSLLTLLATSTTLANVLPVLHQRAIEAAGGVCSVLFEPDARTGAMQPTSGRGPGAQPDGPWTPAATEARFVAAALSRTPPTFVLDADRRMPELSARLGTPSAVLLPLTQGADRPGLLAIGVTGLPRSGPPGAGLAPVADAFVTALELFRLRQSDALQRQLRRVFDDVGTVLATTLNLSAGLESFCRGANPVFGADRTVVWLHDRRARQLVRRASSDPKHVGNLARVPADDPLSVAAGAMRQTRAGIQPGAGGSAASTITVPLHGTRRALGTILFEGIRSESSGAAGLLDQADEAGRLLSSAIENIQLLDDVVRSRRELENTFDSIAHLVAVWDRRGRIVHVNHAFASRVGRTRQQLIDCPLEEFVGPDLRAWLAAHGAGDPQSDADGPVNFEVVDPVLKGPFGVTVTALRNHEGERVGSVLVARDLTPHAKLQAEREELRLRLTQSEKLAALGQFIAGIAHELNNPLQGVLGHLELLRVTGAFPAGLRREVQTIYREADRAAKIVRNLLAFSGSRRLVRRAVSVNVVLQKVLALRAPSCRAAAIEVVRHYDEKLPRVQSDPLLLHQVFLNIVMNAEHAIAATAHGGRIEVRTKGSPARDRVIVSVRDTGKGIPSDVLSRIFDPFYTTKDVGQGTGLGLAITYGIVQEHGGEIVATNHPGGGAVFTIELPIRWPAGGLTDTVPATILGGHPKPIA